MTVRDGADWSAAAYTRALMAQVAPCEATELVVDEPQSGSSAAVSPPPCLEQCGCVVGATRGAVQCVVLDFRREGQLTITFSAGAVVSGTVTRKCWPSGATSNVD